MINVKLEKEKAEQSALLNTDIINKIYAHLQGLSYRKAKYILELAIVHLSDNSGITTL